MRRSHAGAHATVLLLLLFRLMMAIRSACYITSLAAIQVNDGYEERMLQHLLFRSMHGYQERMLQHFSCCFSG